MSYQGVVEFFNRTDWELLSRQKLTLIEMINTLETKRKIEFVADPLWENKMPQTEGADQMISQDSLNNLTGIVHLLDALQDTAQDELGIDAYIKDLGGGS